MKIMLDTNVIISALIFGGRTKRLLSFLLQSKHKIFISEYVDKELREKLEEKWPDVSFEVYAFYRSMSFIFCESSPTTENSIKLRDAKDIPVLCDALYNDIDILLTGDKDFLDVEVSKPFICSPSMLSDFLRIA